MVNCGQCSADILLRRWIRFIGGCLAGFNRVASLTLAFLLCTSGLRSDTLPEALARAKAAYAAAHSNYLAFPGQTATAVALAKACFNLADISSSDDERSKLAQEGIGAAKFASQMDPTNAAAFFYLALNQGELARTKSLGALSLLRQMEKSLLRAADLDPHLEHAGPDHSLGELYRDAPGHPASIGSKAKARAHLERAVSLAPDYPDNHLSLMEGLLHWKENDALQAERAHYRQILPAARQKYTGPEWAQAWHDWDERWKEIQNRATSG